MKNLLACLAVLAAFGAGAQSMPYNPDANDDGYIGSPDLLSFLPLFGSQVGVDSSLTCDYDGTPIEEFFGDVWNGDIIIDSILVQYQTTDSALVYMAGCPDPIWEVVSYERSWTTTGFGEDPAELKWTSTHLGFNRSFRFGFSASEGHFYFNIRDQEVLISDLGEVLGHWIPCAINPYQGSSNCAWSIPFPQSAAVFDENGIHFEHWSDFLSNATYVNILPYWHYAE